MTPQRPRKGIESGRNRKRPGNAQTSRARQQEVSPGATPTLQPLQVAARERRDAMKNKAYRAFPLGQEAGAYLRQNRGRLLPNTYKTYESCLDKLARHFADLDLADFEPSVGTERLEEFIEEEWGESASRTQAKNISILKGFFEWAVLRREAARRPGAADPPAEEARRRANDVLGGSGARDHRPAGGHAERDVRRERIVNRSRGARRIWLNEAVYAPGRNRTCDLALRRRALYPLSYRRGAAKSSRRLRSL
jgi:hypothetical protein